MYGIWPQTVQTSQSSFKPKLNGNISYLKLWFLKGPIFLLLFLARVISQGKDTICWLTISFFSPDLSLIYFKIIFRAQHIICMKKDWWKIGQKEQSALKQARRNWRLKRAFWQLKPSFQSALSFLIAQIKWSLYCHLCSPEEIQCSLVERDKERQIQS